MRKSHFSDCVVEKVMDDIFNNLLVNYQIAVGQLTQQTGVRPDISRLNEFNQFCAKCYAESKESVAKAFALQNKSQSIGG